MLKQVIMASIALAGFIALSQCKKDNDQLDGTYVSEKSENLGNGTFGYREFVFNDDQWELKFTLYFDSLRTKPVFRFRAKGPYSVQGASSKVTGADNALFTFDKKYVTLLSSDAAVATGFGFTACNLQVNTEKDITDSGCSFLVSKSACGQEYDLLKKDGDKLFLGARPATGDMCAEDRRPTALGAALVKR